MRRSLSLAKSIRKRYTAGWIFSSFLSTATQRAYKLVVGQFLVVAERGQDAGQAFCPVAGAEGTAFGSQALDNDFVRVADHGFNRALVLVGVVSARSLLY